MKSILFSLICLFSFLVNLHSQDTSVLKDLRPPLDIPLYLSGNFGELRTNHFHTGLDFKTQGVIGKKILASEEGFVSRIKVSEWGYGKALYIDHPNGYTTVYGHLESFAPKIRKFVRKVQYRNQTYTLDMKPGTQQLQVDKGELIAYSGNTGSSGGPHLHYEVRETASEKPVNPLRFMNLEITDHLPPNLEGLRAYPLNDTTFIDESPSTRGYYISGNHGNYRLRNGRPLRIHGEVGFAIRSTDKLNGYPNECGVYGIQLFVDDEIIYSMTMDKLDFHTNRYINAHSDYYMIDKYNKHYHRCYLLPNNQLDIYDYLKKKGKTSFTDDLTHLVKIVVKDVHGNKSTLDFKVKAKSEPITKNPDRLGSSHEEVFSFKEANAFEKDGIQLFLPPKSLYQDLEFQFSKSDTLPNTYTPLYHLQDEYTPLHHSYRLRLKTGPIAEPLQEKALVVSYKKGRFRALGGRYKKQWMEARVRDFGSYTVKLDTTAPKIQPLNAREGMTTHDNSVLKFRIRDNLSGIASYDGYVNGKWVLVEYEPKKALLNCHFKEMQPQLKKGEHQFKLMVKDERGNREVFRFGFVKK